MGWQTGVVPPTLRQQNSSGRHVAVPQTTPFVEVAASPDEEVELPVPLLLPDDVVDPDEPPLLDLPPELPRSVPERRSSNDGKRHPTSVAAASAMSSLDQRRINEE